MNGHLGDGIVQIEGGKAFSGHKPKLYSQGFKKMQVSSLALIVVGGGEKINHNLLSQLKC